MFVRFISVFKLPLASVCASNKRIHTFDNGFALSFAHKIYNQERSVLVLEFLPYLSILEDRFACSCTTTCIFVA